MTTLLADARRFQLAQRVVAGLLTLQLLGTAVELCGIFTLVPIFQFIQADGDLASLVDRHREWRLLVDAYAAAGLRVTLATLLCTSFAFLLLRQIAVYVRLLYQVSAREGVVARVRVLAFERFLHVSFAYQDRTPTGEIVNAFTVELNRAVDYLFGQLYLAGMVVVAAAYGLSLLFVSAGMTLVAVFLFGAAFSMLRGQMTKSARIGRDVTRANSEAGGFLVERLKTVRLVRLAGMERAEGDEMSRLTGRQRESLVHLQKLIALVTVMIEPIVIGASFVFVYVSITWFDTSIEEIGLFLIMVLRLLPVVKELAKTGQSMRGTMPAFNAVVQRLESMENERETRVGARKFAGLSRAISFDDVSFAYDGNHAAPALRNVSAEILKGALTALVGPSGAGKSTLIDMLPRLRHPMSGQVLFDGAPLQSFDLRSLRRGIAFAPQTPQLFNVSVADHIRYGKPDATMQSILRTAEMAGVAEFADALPEGYDTLIGEAGVRLSGGERQRLDLARALVQAAPILILDEPASNLDAESEQRLRRAMQRIVTETDTTIIVIAHRLATVAMADQILVLDRGRLVARGTHTELMRSGGWYASAFSAQQDISPPPVSELTFASV